MCGPDYLQIMQNPQTIAAFVQQKVDDKIKWYQKNRQVYVGRTWPTWQDEVLEVFYRGNLSIEVERYGAVVCRTGRVLVIDWMSPCPILNSCLQNGLSTVQVCSTLYHVQYQVLLSLIHPGLLFTRDYSQLRPKAGHCREVIYKPDVEGSKASNPCLAFCNDG